VRDELASGTLMEARRLPGIRETFFAVTLRRRFPSQLALDLCATAAEAESSQRDA
jgi:LysR family transcriptional activator of nhaA